MDGFTAAWVVRRYMQLAMREVEFYPGVYNDPPPDCTNKDVIIVDFSYSPDIMKKLYGESHSLVWIDHHKSAIEAMKDSDFYNAIGNSYSIDYKEHISLTHSGAMLTWLYFFPNEAAPRFIEYVEDRDLWRFNMPATREVNAYAFSLEYGFDTWDKLMQPELIPDMIVGGAAIERKHHKDIAELVRVMVRWIDIGGQYVPVASLPYTLTSDAGHLMCKLVEAKDKSFLIPGKNKWGEFAACYYDTRDHRVFSLRSLDYGADVSLVAKQFNGGGHKHAAGFRVPRGHYLARF